MRAQLHASLQPAKRSLQAHWPTPSVCPNLRSNALTHVSQRQHDVSLRSSSLHDPVNSSYEEQAESTRDSETGGAWSLRLMSLGDKKTRRKVKKKLDVFEPGPPDGEEDSWGKEPGARMAGGMVMEEEEDTGGKVANRARLPAEMRCFDTARIYIRSGNGGNGCVAFRREKFVEFGGPNGGNGGRGGNVWAVVDPDANSLSMFRGQAHWRAQHGVSGQGKQLDGANGPDLLIPVPPGTIVRRKEAEEGSPPLAELLREGDKALLLVGGRGGRGNESFKTSTNTAPALAEKGEEGQETWIDLELKVVADVGIIGIPNAGKSTLLSTLTAARPKIANYPFTTLVPNLGVCELDYRTTVFADVPGLLEGAHEGLGLGHEFLRHVQRCRALVHVIDGTSPDPMGDFRAINLELELFNPDLKDKPQIVAYNKIDVPDSGDFVDVMKEELLAEGVPEEYIVPVSAATGVGVRDLVRVVRRMLDDMGPPVIEQTTDAVNQTELPKILSPARMDEFTIDIEVDGNGTKTFYVDGEALQKFTQMTNWDYYESVKRFQKVLDSSGINGALRSKGVKKGDTVVICGAEFDWQDDQSDSALYEAYVQDMANRNQARAGSAHWPKTALRDDRKKKYMGKRGEDRWE